MFSFTSAMFAAGQYPPHTLNKRRAGCQIHTGLPPAEFHSVCCSELYEADNIIDCTIYFFLGILYFV